MISDATQQLNGEVKLATQYPAESGHWYDPKTGSQVELPPRTWAKTAIKKGLVPGVTSITRLVARGALERWKINRAIVHAYDILNEVPVGYAEECLIDDVWELLNAESEAITGRGKELHAAIEQAAQGQEFDAKWLKHLDAVSDALLQHGLLLSQGSSEHSFSTERYGGKVDWHNDTWLLDFKTKDRIGDQKWALMRKGVKKSFRLFDIKEEADKAANENNESFPRDQWFVEKRYDLAYPEHAQQLAAYGFGLDPLWMCVTKPRRAANVFVGVEDAAVHVHEWDEDQILKGYRKFEHLLNYWWEDKQP